MNTTEIIVFSDMVFTKFEQSIRGRDWLCFNLLLFFGYGIIQYVQQLLLFNTYPFLSYFWMELEAWNPENVTFCYFKKLKTCTEDLDCR